jgi:nucleotide-binding universal stress UspA family protein
MMFTRILVPTDFSGPSDAALEYARALAARFHASLQLLHVVESPFVASPLGNEAFIADLPAVQTALFDDAKARLAHRAAAARPGGPPITTEIVTGTTAMAILEVARDRHVDLIVMGTHGREGMAHLLMGSVAEKVVRSAPCPVLTVRQMPARVVQFDAAVPALAAAVA